MDFNSLTVMSAFFISIMILTGLLFYILPRLTRPTIYFAVTVPPDFRDSDAGRATLATYRGHIIIHTLVAIVLVLVALNFKMVSVLILGILWQEVGAVAAFLRARKQVMPRGVTSNAMPEADSAVAPMPLPGGWLMQAGPFLLLAATGFWLRSNWDQIPERFPVHWGFDGRPNGWATRSVAGVYGPLVMGFAVCAGLFLLNYGIAAMTRRIRLSAGPGEMEHRFRHLMLCILVALEYFIALLFSWIGLFALRAGKSMPSPALLLTVSVGFFVLILFILVRIGQGGSRLAAAGGGEPVPIGDGTLDRHWKAGLFYVNRDDPAVFVEKRFGIGYTMNFARPLSWIILILLVGIPLALVFVLARLQ